MTYALSVARRDIDRDSTVSITHNLRSDGVTLRRQLLLVERDRPRVATHCSRHTSDAAVREVARGAQAFNKPRTQREDPCR